MAATRLIALHINKGKTVAQCLADRTDYSENAAKTEDGKYISAYACDAKTCDEEFLLSKRQYEHITGRTQAHDVIAYQIRQSFKPGEITPEEANKVGYETAMRFTKGKHAFIVATHVDRAHIHNHIIFNSTTLDCTRKFRDFRLSGLALARLSDIVCLEHRLSVIIRKPYGERQKRTEYPERKSQRDEICEAIDVALARKPKDFRELIGILQEAGYEYKDGKQPALRGNGHARFARFRSLGRGYSLEELCEVIAGNAVHKSKFAEKNRTSARSAQVHQKAELSFLIDVRAKMQAGKGTGYARWAKAAHRDVPLPDCLAKCLREAKENSTSDYVVANSDGEPLSYTQFKRLWQYIVTRTVKERSYYRYENGKRVKHTVKPVLGERAAHNGKVVYSLDFEVTPHLLRHTYITNLIHASVDPKTVQYLAGHENSKITMDIYAKAKYNRPDELAGILEDTFTLWDAE